MRRDRIRRALTLLLGAALLPILWVDTASAHGSVIDPASRNYGCWDRWGDDFQNPAMQQEDPMCWQAWQDNPNAMWNWNGLYRNNVGGDHQGAIPDGQLCSGGQTEGGRYRSMDAVGPWKTTDIGSTFSINLYDQASHGADYFLVYVTRQGYDALTQPLRWSDLELVRQTGRYAPANNYVIDNVTAPGRSGRHVVYTIWQASHMDQSYYICSDVNFR
ncbi:lytic polysaccharide monooxygenase auxiliary activity family 9 protein [Actinomadura geliboluensis]|uniref:Lytic polysaccharide monooxygenase n=1 Tax=Actinomadura geliboluensis TaxID=882440 RepID=A0A5S4FXX4_9ACTN|nr:lytic polysaccharide monooxygenase auxiliary activity family 9 protein [Actinomadura geliboluensis]TMR25539.1 lytic polysaccharide monooxygenase [Actinomadura geliboluensis]